MAKGSKSKSKGGKGKTKAPNRPPPPKAPTASEERAERAAISVMIGLTLFGLALSWVFAQHRLLPYLEGQEAEAAVRAKEKVILDAFRKNGPKKGLELIGWETQVYPRLTQVTFVYLDKNTNERKAFWWAYLPDAPEGERVQRIKSVGQFVDNYLLPTVDQLHKDVTGVPGPLARVQHRLETY